MGISINSILLMGLVEKVSRLETQTEVPSCQITLVTTEEIVDKNANLKEFEEWHTVIVRGQRARDCVKNLRPNTTIFVEGAIRRFHGNRHNAWPHIHCKVIRILSEPNTKNNFCIPATISTAKNGQEPHPDLWTL